VLRVVLASQPPLFQSLAVPLAQSILALAEIDLSLVLEDPRVLFQVYKKAILIPEAQASEFLLCEKLVKSGSINSRVYTLVINLLGDFATIGSVGAEWEQRNDILQRRMTASRTPDRPFGPPPNCANE